MKASNKHPKPPFKQAPALPKQESKNPPQAYGGKAGTAEHAAENAAFTENTYSARLRRAIKDQGGRLGSHEAVRHEATDSAHAAKPGDVMQSTADDSAVAKLTQLDSTPLEERLKKTISKLRTHSTPETPVLSSPEVERMVTASTFSPHGGEPVRALSDVAKTPPRLACRSNPDR
ncbi:MAG: hypothetical protein QXO22_01725 [Thermosphaera sp.]